jgi:hypothetical protein
MTDGSQSNSTSKSNKTLGSVGFMLSSSLIHYYFLRRRERNEQSFSGWAEERLGRSGFSPKKSDWWQIKLLAGDHLQGSRSGKSSLSWPRLLILRILSRFRR